VIVRLVVVTNSGGAAAHPSDWTIQVSGAAGSGASPNFFAGSASGTAVSIPAGLAYSIFSNNARTDYAAVPAPSADCSQGTGGLAAGSTVTCTITRNDRPRVLVKTHVINDDGGSASANDWSVTVSGSQVSPSAFTGSEAGTVVVVGVEQTYTVQMSSAVDGQYALTKAGDCGPTFLGVDAPQATCTFTYDDNPPPPSQSMPWLLLPFVPKRRWRSIPTS
jgi:hypothetical protein